MITPKRPKALISLVLSLSLLFAITTVSYAKYNSSQNILANAEQAESASVEGRFASLESGQPAEISAPTSSAQELTGPSRIVIPDIGVNAKIETRGVASDGSVDVPKSLWTTAWYNGSSKPGQPGPAMIVGHYSAHGRAVFAKLNKLRPGQRIVVNDANNTPHTFQVTQIRDFKASEVPMAELLGNRSSKPRLEIITCGGSYIKNARDFTNRTVVTAEII